MSGKNFVLLDLGEDLLTLRFLAKRTRGFSLEAGHSHNEGPVSGLSIVLQFSKNMLVLPMRKGSERSRSSTACSPTDDRRG